MTMPHFTHHRPTTLEQALRLLREHQGHARLLAGGTDLINQLRAGQLETAHLISLNGVSELQRLAFDDDEGLEIGAGVRISDVGALPAVQHNYPALAHACAVMATTQVRNMATVAGNLANGSPCADTAPPLMVYEAQIELVGPDGSRTLPLASFYRGRKQTEVRPTEIIRAIRLPRPEDRTGSAYLRLSARSKVDMSAAGVAALIVLDGDGRVRRARLALGSVAPTPLRCPDAEKLLTGQLPAAELLVRTASACVATARPIDDLRGSAAWRRLAIEVLATRALRRCTEIAPSGPGGAR